VTGTPPVAKTLAVVFICIAASCSDGGGRATTDARGGRDLGFVTPDERTDASDGQSSRGEDALSADRDSSAPGDLRVTQDVGSRSDASRDLARDQMPGDPRPGDGSEQVCIELENTAPIVEETVVPQPAPTAKGGSIEPGKYHLTAWTWFNGIMEAPEPDLIPSHRITLVIDKDLKAIRAAMNRATGEMFTDEYEIHIDGSTSIAMNYVCPDLSGAYYYEYDATPTSLILYVNERYYIVEEGGGYAMVYTKQ